MRAVAVVEREWQKDTERARERERERKSGDMASSCLQTA
jgi:hypothetical protein